MTAEGAKRTCCTRCKKYLADGDYYQSQPSWCKACCKSYQAANYRANKERRQAKGKEWAAANRRKTREYSFRAQQRRRGRAIAAYGGRCACCGEHRTEFLAIDHIHNDGKEHRRQLGAKNIYHWLEVNGYPQDRFQLLCHNCNFAKNLYGQCPHVAERGLLIAV